MGTRVASCAMLLSLCLMTLVLRIGSVAAGVHYIVSFETINLTLGGFGIRLSTEVAIQVNPPLFYISGTSDRCGVRVWAPRVFTYSEVRIMYEGRDYSATFWSLLGDNKIDVARVPGLGSMYIKINGRVEVNSHVDGPISCSPKMLTFSSEGTESLHLKHHNMFSFGTIQITLVPKLILSIAVGIESLGNPIVEYSEDIGSLDASRDVVERVTTYPVIGIGLLIAVPFIALIVIGVYAGRKRKKATQITHPHKEKMTRIAHTRQEKEEGPVLKGWKYCPRCGAGDSARAIVCQKCGYEYLFEMPSAEYEILKLCDKEHTISDMMKETGKTETDVNYLLAKLKGKALIRSVRMGDKHVYERI